MQLVVSDSNKKVEHVKGLYKECEEKIAWFE